MHREEVKKRVENSTYDELEQWREHVFYCLDYFQQAKNHFEIEECEFLLQLIHKQMKVLKNGKKSSSHE